MEYEYDAQQLAQQQQVLLRAQDYIPDAVKSFIVYFQRMLVEKKVTELHDCYESAFNQITEKFYKTSPWPDPEIVLGLVQDDTFVIFYSELYFRHIYSRLQPTKENRYASYNNYCNMFSYIINSPTPVDYELPTVWAWEIIEEFIYQYNSFALYRARTLRRLHEDKAGENASLAEEVASLRSSPDCWGAYSVLNVLYTLVRKSRINDQLRAIRENEDANAVSGEYGSKSLYKMLGYFSLTGLLRVHTLHGDFALALNTLNEIQLNKKSLFARVVGAHFNTYYYVGFCYLMLGRYADAIKQFSHILLYINRTKNFDKSSRYGSVAKKCDQMYALLTISVTLSPTRLDDLVHTGLRDKYGDQLARMQRGGPDALALFEQLFLFAAPKFISPSVPDFDHLELNMDPVHHHLKVFMTDVKNATLGPVIKSYLNLYATMDIKKLASFIETDKEALRSALVSFKLKNRQLKWKEGVLLKGEVGNISEIDIALDRDLIHIAEAKGSRKHGDWLIRNTGKNYMTQEFIENPERDDRRTHYQSRK